MRGKPGPDFRARQAAAEFEETTVKNMIFGVIAAAVLALASAPPAKAEITEVEILFISVDQNGDLVLSKGEFLIIAIRQFDLTDSDRDGLLEKQELGELADDPEFSDNDANKDSALSIEEMIEEKLADFDEADTDKDGSLSLDEVKAKYKSAQ
ncbi:MAG: hypothetical protein ACC631_10110 [Halocynthiibacter sp.]